MKAHWAARFPTAVFQLIVWGLIVALSTVPLVVQGRLLGAGGWLALWVVTGVALTTAWARILQRLPESAFRVPWALGLIPVAAVASLVWLGVTLLGEPLVGAEPSLPQLAEPPPAGFDPTIPLRIGRGTVIFVTWSGLYVISLLNRRMQVERERTLAAQAQASNAQLLSLRSQLNPHFLFNALNSVVGLIAENPKAAQTMVRDVSKLLRTALKRTTHLTTLSEEVNFNELYLKCEKVRFEDKLVYSFHIEEGLNDAEIPTMLLQPLIENALKHGRASNEQPLVVTVEARTDGELLTITIRNSGRLTAQNPEGVGIRNVAERLRTSYAHKQTFSLNEESGWVTARLVWPLVRVKAR